MNCTLTLAELWDARVEKLLRLLPVFIQRAVRGLRKPQRKWLRVPSGLLFIFGGVFSILPVFGLWMLPVGLALMAEDVPGMKPGLERASQKIEGWVARAKAVWNKSDS